MEADAMPFENENKYLHQIEILALTSFYISLFFKTSF
jgi:hypothetical protein